MADGATLDQELGQLLEQETFPPPEEFRARALSGTCRSTRRPSATPRAGGRSRPRRCTGSSSWDQVLDWSNPPFAKWFVGGKLNASYNCLDRHVEAGLRRPRRVPLARRGGRGARRHLRRAARRRPALRQRAEGPRDRRRRRRRDLPADDPRGRRRDARLRAHRRAPQRRLRRLRAESVRERMEFSEAKALVTVDGARRKGKTAPIKAAVDEVDARPRRAIVVAPHRRRRADGGRTRRLVPRADGGRRRRVPGRAARRRAPAVHPLHVGLDGQAEGDPAHHRRLPDAASRGRTRTSSTSSPTRTSTGARPTSAGSPATPTSSTGRSPTARRR